MKHGQWAFSHLTQTRPTLAGKVLSCSCLDSLGQNHIPCILPWLPCCGKGPGLPWRLQTQRRLRNSSSLAGSWCVLPTGTQVPHLSQRSALGHREVKGLPEVKLMLHRQFKGLALLQNLEFIIFQIQIICQKVMPHTHLCALLYANTEHQLFVRELSYMLHIQGICCLGLDFESKLGKQNILHVRMPTQTSNFSICSYKILHRALAFLHTVSMKLESLTHLTIQPLHPFLSVTGCSFKIVDRSVYFQKMTLKLYSIPYNNNYEFNHMKPRTIVKKWFRSLYAILLKSAERWKVYRVHCSRQTKSVLEISLDSKVLALTSKNTVFRQN